MLLLVRRDLLELQCVLLLARRDLPELQCMPVDGSMERGMMSEHPKFSRAARIGGNAAKILFSELAVEEGSWVENE